jgi:hypothetical protein
MKEFLKKIPVVKALSKLVSSKKQFAGSEAYWENRYKTGGHSGAGSYNNLALFKADVLNKFVDEHQIKSVIEFGSGDGNQLKLFNFPLYTGVDVSRVAIDQCKLIFAGDETKRFVHSAAFTPTSAEMALSLDVIYHLVEDYEDDGTYASHVKPRKFTDWVEKNTSFRLLQLIPNAFPFDAEKPDSTSFADFYIYESN